MVELSTGMEYIIFKKFSRSIETSQLTLSSASGPPMLQFVTPPKKEQPQTKAGIAYQKVQKLFAGENLVSTLTSLPSSRMTCAESKVKKQRVSDDKTYVKGWYRKPCPSGTMSVKVGRTMKGPYQ